jgi:hypothetical protein
LPLLLPWSTCRFARHIRNSLQLPRECVAGIGRER